MRKDVIDIVTVGYMALIGVTAGLLVTAFADAVKSAELPAEGVTIEFVREEEVNRETVDLDGNSSYLQTRPVRTLLNR